MPYIGNTPAEKYAAFDVQYFTTSATASYTLDHAVTNELDIRLVINNVIQEPGSGKAYTASGTALTLSANTASTDVMYCIFLGRAIQSTVPATNSITAAMMFSGFADGIIEADQWRITANHSGVADITANWERVDTDGYGTIGSAMTESSGIFSFPSTGIYLIQGAFRILAAGNDTTVNVVLHARLRQYIGLRASSILFHLYHSHNFYFLVNRTLKSTKMNLQRCRVYLFLTCNFCL